MAAFQTFARLHLFLLVAQLLSAVGIVVLFFYYPPSAPNPDMDRILQIVSLLFAGAGYFGGSMWLFNKSIRDIHNMPNDVSLRFAVFRKTSLIQWAMLAGPYLFCWVSFLLTGNLAFPALAIFLFVFFLLLRPNSLRAAIQMRVRESELLQLK